MAKSPASRVRVGIGGWSYEPWRGVFYPDGLAQRRELEFASRALNSIEINSTWYGAQRPESFARWRDETPDDFVFALKAPRFVMHRRALAEAGESIERFFASGVMELGDKLGPVNWQLAPGKPFDPDDYARFLELLPASVDGRPIRHALEVRDESFCCAEFVALARAHKAAIVIAGDAPYPLIGDLSAPFVYARIMGTQENRKLGYGPTALERWTRRALEWAAGDTPKDLDTFAEPAGKAPRDVFLYVISGHKVSNPAAAQALMVRLRKAGSA